MKTFECNEDVGVVRSCVPRHCVARRGIFANLLLASPVVVQLKQNDKIDPGTLWPIRQTRSELLLYRRRCRLCGQRVNVFRSPSGDCLSAQMFAQEVCCRGIFALSLFIYDLTVFHSDLLSDTKGRTEPRRAARAL